MPKGPEGQKRPGDVVGAAIMVGRIATGEIKDTGHSESTKGQRKGGLARAKKLTAEQRAEIATKAARARWRETT